MVKDVKRWLTNKVDLIHCLAQMNLDHVIQKIACHLDTISLRNCERVSVIWKEIFSRLRKAKNWRQSKSSDRSDCLKFQSDITAMDLNSNWLAVGLFNGTLCILNRESMSPVWISKVHTEAVLAVSLNDDFCLTGSTRGSIRIWSVPSGEMVASIPVHKDWITSISSLPRLSLSIATSLDGKITLITPGGTRNASLCRPRVGFVTADSLSGKQLICSDVSSTVIVVGGTSGLWMAPLKCPDRLERVEMVDPDSCVTKCKIRDSLVAAVSQSKILIFSTDLSFSRIVNASGQTIFSDIAFSHCGKSFFSVSCDQMLCSHDITENLSGNALIETRKVLKTKWLPKEVLIDHESNVIIVSSGCSQTELLFADASEIDHEQQILGDEFGVTNITDRRCEGCGFELSPNCRIFSSNDQTSRHMLMDCQRHLAARLRMMKAVGSILWESHKKQTVENLFKTRMIQDIGACKESMCEMLLYGSEVIEIEDSLKIQEIVQTFAAEVAIPR